MSISQAARWRTSRWTGTQAHSHDQAGEKAAWLGSDLTFEGGKIVDELGLGGIGVERLQLADRFGQEPRGVAAPVVEAGADACVEEVADEAAGRHHQHRDESDVRWRRAGAEIAVIENEHRAEHAQDDVQVEPAADADDAAQPQQLAQRIEQQEAHGGRSGDAEPEAKAVPETTSFRARSTSAIQPPKRLVSARQPQLGVRMQPGEDEQHHRDIDQEAAVAPRRGLPSTARLHCLALAGRDDVRQSDDLFLSHVAAMPVP